MGLSAARQVALITFQQRKYNLKGKVAVAAKVPARQWTVRRSSDVLPCWEYNYDCDCDCD